MDARASYNLPTCGILVYDFFYPLNSSYRPFSLVWNTVCGFAESKSSLIAFRFLAGLGGSAPLSIGGGVIGDLFDAERRGQAIAIYSLAPLIAPVVGPVAGAWIAEKSTWRWVVRLGLFFNPVPLPGVDEHSSGLRPLWMPLSKDQAYF
jgi:MFS family permease